MSHDDADMLDLDMLDDESPWDMYVVRHPSGKYYQLHLVDQNESGLIFEVDDALVRSGVFPDKHLDSRFFPEMGLELFFVPSPPIWEH